MTAYSLLTTMLPVAIVIMPVLIAAFVIASVIESMLEALALGGAANGSIRRVAGIVRDVALRTLGAFFALMLIIVSGTTLLAQNEFGAFLEQQR